VEEAIDACLEAVDCSRICLDELSKI